MAVRIVKLGSPRNRDEGHRVGTVRRPPRKVVQAIVATVPLLLTPVLFYALVDITSFLGIT